MANGIGGIGGAVLETVERAPHLMVAAQAIIEEAEQSTERFFTQASGLAEGYASRTGILSLPFRLARLDAPPIRRNDAARTPSDSAYDGFFIGANGQAYTPSTPLNQIPAVRPSDGREPNETLIYINGINTTKDGQFRSLQLIADRTGAQVIGIHNSTQGGVRDVIQSAGDTFDIGRNRTVDTLADTIYGEIKQGRPVHLMAHSQGALISSRALEDVRLRLRLEDGLSRRETERMLGLVKVETFGGAAGFYPDGPQYVHYVNRRDAVASLFGLGPFSNPLVHPGRGAVVYHFSEADRSHDLHETYLPRRVPFEQARRRDFRR
jgi:pimeloyl-ACP methyl ester carboxylesterase